MTVILQAISSGISYSAEYFKPKRFCTDWTYNSPVKAIGLAAIAVVAKMGSELYDLSPSTPVIVVTVVAAAYLAIPACSKVCDLLTYRKFEQELERWKKDPQAGGDKETATKRILEAFVNKDSCLDLHNLGLTTLPDCFKSLSSLQELSLIKNQLTSLPDSLGNLQALQKLSLSENQLTSLPDSLGNLQALQWLLLNNNQLTSLPDSLGNLHALQQLSLEHNQLTSLPDSLGNLQALQWLYLSENQLTSLPDSLGNLQALQTLDLGRNQLTSLPDSLDNLQALKQLRLESNQLTPLPDSLGNLQALQTLDLGRNQLTSLPDSLGNLHALQTLFIGSNRLTSLPDSLGNLHALQTLFIESNQLTSLPDSLGNLHALQWLCLNNNQLTSLPHTIGTCINLSTISVIHNKSLTELPLSLGDIPGITYLDIEGTQISRNSLETTLASCRAKRNASASARLPAKLAQWCSYAGLEPESLAFVLDFKINEKIAIMEWLTRLAKAKDFGKHQKRLAEVACTMLKDTEHHANFKEAFISQITVNNERCEDRAAMAFNELYVMWKILASKLDASMKEKLCLLNQAGRTLALRKVLSEKIDAHQTKEKCILEESVEIYLYYEIVLAQKLDLLTFIQSMSHELSGKSDWIDENKLIQEVNELYLDEVVVLPSFDQVMKEDQFAQEQIDLIEEKFQTMLEQLGDLPQGHPDSPDVLNWHVAMGACGKSRTAALKEAKKQWLKAQNTALKIKSPF